MLGFTAKNKLKIALLVFTVLSLLLLNNLQERRMMNRINENVISIYEDRVVVGDYILNLSNKTQEIIKILSSQNLNELTKISFILGEMNTVNQLYDKTFLTDVERTSFDKFVKECRQIEEYAVVKNYSAALESSIQAEKILIKLSSIQVEEGKNKLDEVLSLTGTGSFLAYLEIVILIVIAALVQWLVLSAKPLVDKRSFDTHRMN